MHTIHTLTPVQSAERLQIVDVLRGFALLGILFVNMELFTHPGQYIVLPYDFSQPWFDQLAFWLVRFLAEGKFYSMFSFLFGLGLYLQMTRVEGRGDQFVPLYIRRLLVLLVFGLIHAFLIWMGDILTVYAVFGFILLLFRKARPRTLLIWAVILLLTPIVINLALTGLMALGRSSPEGAVQMETVLVQQEAIYETGAAQAYEVYANGNFFEITAQRASDLTLIGLGSLFALGPGVLMMFLLGMYFGKRELLHNLEANAPLFRKLLVGGLAVGLIGSLAYASLSLPLARYDLTFTLFIAQMAHTFGAPAMCLAYISVFALLWLQPAWRERLKVLAPVGQMALTNYLTQSIVCTLIFYGYGLGFFGQVGTAGGLALAVALYSLQVVISNWWMKRFNYGPVEWLWRTLTYLKPQPMRRQSQPAPQLAAS